jgi:hypothetical protein
MSQINPVAAARSLKNDANAPRAPRRVANARPSEEHRAQEYLTDDESLDGLPTGSGGEASLPRSDGSARSSRGMPGTTT